MSLVTRTLVLCALASLSQARPRSVHIKDLNSNTTTALCPVLVTVDTNLHRVPRHIKHIKCAPQPNPMCAELRFTDKECCRYRSDAHNYEMSCQEVWDLVVVADSRDMKKRMENVPVGCVCTINKGWISVNAQELPSSSR